ncbi:MAG: hypothetical protein IT370_07090 [Deltaproteobacteria bacterium]|nr:hypothetical protein [Deltaproteobacteria bacterium]
MRMRRITIGLGALLLLALPSREARAVDPLDATQAFMYGEFATATGAPTQGAPPARLDALARDLGPLPEGTWLRFQNLGGTAFKGHAAQLRIDDAGQLFLVVHLGAATAATLAAPQWPAQPSQLIDQTVLAKLRQQALALAAGPSYRGHAGQPHAPTFVLTVRTGPRTQRDYFFEATETPFIQHLRRITYFALTSPLAPPKVKVKAKAKTKAPAKPKLKAPR